MTMSNRFSLTPSGSGSGGPAISGLAEPELSAVAAARRLALDVVVRAADRAGPALQTVAEADQVELLLVVPLVDARRAEVVAVLAFALVRADALVADLDVRVAGVLGVLDREQLVGQLLHELFNPIVEEIAGARKGLRGPSRPTART